MKKEWFTKKDLVNLGSGSSTPDKAWLTIFNQMSQEERQLLTTFVMREGIDTLLCCLHTNAKTSHTLLMKN